MPNTEPTLQLAQPKFNKAFQLFCNILFKAYCPLTAINKPDFDGPFILCSNHSSHLDTPALMQATGLPLSKFVSIAAKDYFFHEGKKRSLSSRLLNLAPLDRSSSLKDLGNTANLCRDFLQTQQGGLLLYPEGTRSPDGKLQRFKKGASMLAMHLGLPIIPAYITGAYAAMPKGRNWVKPGRIQVRFGDPIQVDSICSYENDAFDDLIDHCASITDQLEQAIVDLKNAHESESK